MAPFHSYVVGLSAAIEVVSPRRILEWGPGHSTSLFLATPCVEIIDCIEHKEKWYNILREQLKHVPKANEKILNLCYFPDLKDRYVNYLTGPYDLIFVDGRQRTRCLKKAKELLDPAGLVVIHDAERTPYHFAIREWPFYQFTERQEIAVMSFDPNRIREWNEIMRLKCLTTPSS